MPSDSNLYQRGGTFYARVQVNGRDVRRSLRTTDRRVALRRLKDLLTQADDRRAGVAPPPATHPWEEAVAAWADLKLSSLRPGTQDRYRTSLKQLHPHFGGQDVGKLTSADFHAYALARMRGGTKPATVRRDLTIASLVMRVAKRAGWAKANPVLDEMAEIEEKREPVRPVATRNIARVVRIAPAGLCPLLRFLARTGCREQEAASLEWSDLRLDASPPTCTFHHTKTRSPRVIELPPQVVRDLRRLPRDRKCAYVFRAGQTGTRYFHSGNHFRDLVIRIQKEAAPRGGRGHVLHPFRPYRLHDLRHTFAIRALQKGWSIYRLARHLGHTSTQTTERYAAWLARRPE